MMEGSAPRPVVVGVDASAAAVQAARFGAEEARQRGAPLRILHVVRWPFDGMVTPPPDLDVPLLQRTGGEGVLQAVADAVAGTVGAGGLSTSLIDGDPVTVLREASAESQLMVLGSRGVGGLAGLLLGSTASGVVAHARCPVVVLPDESSVLVRPRRSVVVGVEGRAADEEVLAFAFAEAAARDTDLVAVHAWQDVALGPALRSVGPLVDWAGVLADEERALAGSLADWRNKEPDVVVRQAVVRDGTARALVAASMTAHLLVVGHRPRRTLGSVTHGVLHRATCPVAVVPVGSGADR